LKEDSALSKRSGVACNILTKSYIRTTGYALSNTCSELYCVQFWTPCLSLQHTSALQAHCGEHCDSEFSSWQDTNFKYTYW